MLEYKLSRQVMVNQDFINSKKKKEKKMNETRALTGNILIKPLNNFEKKF